MTAEAKRADDAPSASVAKRVRGLPELATPEAVAEWLGVSRHAVYVMVCRGKIPQHMTFKIGRLLRFDAAQLREWLSESRVSSRKSAK